MPEDLIRTKLARYIEQVAADTGSGKVPATWGGHQLVALIRHWGYRGHDWETPDAFDQFDLVMMDLECFADGSRTSDDDIMAAARAVASAAKTVSAALPLSPGTASPVCRRESCALRETQERGRRHSRCLLLVVDVA